MNYYSLLALYILASVISQFLTTTPIHLFDVGSIPFWLPLSAITVVPLVDVLRSFTQAQAEREGRTFKTVCRQMLILSLSTAALCVVFAGLPLPIFVGVLLAVTFGGIVDILVFKRMGQYFTSPVKRMAVSNLAATLLGSGLVFFVAFTDFVFTDNSLKMPGAHVIVGWLCQSFFIWLSGLVMAYAFGKATKQNKAT